MAFRVEPTDISAYGRQIGRAHSDIAAGRRHLEKGTEVDSSFPSELWQLVVGRHGTQVAQARHAMRALERAVAACERELVGTARYYRLTDHEEAARVDRTYPGGRAERPANGPTGSRDFRDVAEPTAELPGGTSGVLDSVKQGVKDRYDGLVGSRVDGVVGGGGNPALGVLGVGLDLVSPSTLVNEGLKLAFDFDLFGEAAKLVAGDWASYESCAATWSQVGRLCGKVADNVAAGNNQLSESWTGNAADTRWEYFEGLAGKLTGTGGCLLDLERAYEQVAAAVAQFAEGMKAALLFISDLAIAAAVEAAAAAGAAATGVGLVLTGGAAALIAAKVAMMISRWSDVINALTVLYATVNAVFGAGDAVLNGQLDAVRSFPLPCSAYDHQAV
ncbi:hypothetical protein [Streptomyces alkaliterrae]|uniref:Outer membrane channel protein CpnT-like N-terminal domain-containing protein n=1 Tax=Streptomyces alkaliterrae TaxID=2213162 RepID=A0A5P0YJ44_9ACTN|nr:hypothetical protein [Streptomyces alkaliterrae]MBB1259529.1 hypothetical protein [Streptomyces alkaliterrae]MQS00345.1 hypothetical protein [Streptomyces alkaliterrae]